MPSLKNPKADLISKYSFHLKTGLILSLSVIIIAFKLSPNEIKTEIKIIADPPIPVIPEVRTTQKPEIPPPPKAPDIIAAATDDVLNDIILPDIDDIKPVKLPDKPPKPKIDFSDEKFIDVPPELPQPVGGFKAIQEKVHFTEIAKKAGIDGTVFIQAKIDKEGNVVEAIIIKGIGGGLNEEALNAVLTTKFIPGKQRGRPVNVKMVIPIKFVLR